LTTAVDKTATDSRFTTFRKTIGGTVWLGMAQVCGVVSGLAIVGGFGYFATTDDALGRYRTVVVCFMIATGALTLPGMAGAVAQSAARGFDGTLASAYRLRLRFSLLGSVALLAASGVYWASGFEIIAGSLIIPALVLPWTSATASCGTFFRGRMMFSHSAAWESGSRIFAAVLTVATLWMTGSVVWTIGAFMVGTMLGNMAGYGWAWSLRRNDDIDKGFHRFGYHLSAMTAIGVLEMYADTLILGAFAPMKVVAAYHAAVVLQLQIRIGVMLVAQTLHPRFSQCEDLRTAWRLFRQMFVPVLMLIAGACLALYFLTPWIVQTINNGRYPESEPLAQTLVLAGILFTPSVLMRALLSAHRRVRQLYVYDIVFPLTQIGAWIIGARWYGLEGMVWARVIVLALAQGLMLGLVIWALRSPGDSSGATTPHHEGTARP
jgi:O-antigen/teichoic acid export membrane protein